jgi:hypothetical protein
MEYQWPRDIEAEIYFLRSDEGGRNGPVMSGYRGQFYYDGHDWDGIQQYPEAEKWIYPGETTKAIISFLSPHMHSGKLFPGKEFLVREGSKTVGRGKVLKILDLETSAQKRRDETVPLYRPTGPDELELVKKSGFKRWPPRLPEQPIFYPVTNDEYAKDIAINWNKKESQVGYVTRFRVRKVFMDNYPVQRVGATHHSEWWIPAEKLEELNDNIVGLIEVIGEYR